MTPIRLNGEERYLDTALTLSDLLKEINITSPAVAVAVNSEIIPRSELKTREIRPYDHVEIIHPVGGG